MEVNSKLIQRPPEALMWVLQVPSVAKHLDAVHVSSWWTVLNILSCWQAKAGLAGCTHSSVRTHTLIRKWGLAGTHSCTAGETVTVLPRMSWLGHRGGSSASFCDFTVTSVTETLIEQSQKEGVPWDKPWESTFKGTTVLLVCQRCQVGFPGGSGGICLQCRNHRFDPWIGKIPWRRPWQPTPVFMPRKIPWTEEPAGLQSMGLHSQTPLKWLSTHTQGIKQEPITQFSPHPKWWDFVRSWGDFLQYGIVPHQSEVMPVIAMEQIPEGVWAPTLFGSWMMGKFQDKSLCSCTEGLGQWLLESREESILMLLWAQVNTKLRGFSSGSVVKNVPANGGDTSSIPGLWRSHMPWSNWTHVPQLLSLCSRAGELQLLRPCAAVTEARVP